jgi:hypothetical protein
MRPDTGWHGARLLAALYLALLTVASPAATVEQQTLEHLDRIRAIKAGADRKATERYNRQMDEAWKFFTANKGAVLPVLRRELSMELRKGERNQMVLLDIGYFLRLQAEAPDKELGRRALLALDATAEVVRLNQQQLFKFAHAVAPDRDPAMLGFLDRVFLRGSVTTFIPQHALPLDETLVCVFLYGIYGEGAEGHLRSMLRDRSLARRIIEILIWIGSPDSVEEVSAAMVAARDYETFVRGTAFMMKAGGPRGRAMMLALNPGDFDARSREYYGKVRRDIEATAYELLRGQFGRFPGDARLGDGELKRRLSAMHANYGKDDRTSPEAVVNSGLPAAFLIGELTRIRARMFHRVSDEALTDVVVTNALLNTLRYRGK